MKDRLRRIIGRCSALALVFVPLALVGCSDEGVTVTQPTAAAVQAAAAQDFWPEAISIPTGFEPEGIELGRGHEFFVGANSLASLFGPAFFGIPHDLSEFAGAVSPVQFAL